MIKFLLKGMLRDPSRSRLPLIVVGLGSFLTVALFCWLKGVIGQSVEMEAAFNSGHLKVVTRGMAQESDLMPLDLALTDCERLMDGLRRRYPQISWTARIRFGALLDIPDANGQTKAQGPASCWALDLLTPLSQESQRLGIGKCLVWGNLPRRDGEILITHELARRLGLGERDRVTLIGSTMDGALAVRNFTVVGAVRFGAAALDRGALIMDLSQARRFLDMEDAAGEILGFLNGGYDERTAESLAHDFNAGLDGDQFSPVMLKLSQQKGMAEYLGYIDRVTFIMVAGFIFAMSLVLWNSGLLGGLRRYGEFGLRLALGEGHRHLYLSMILESAMIGIVGSALGTALGLALSAYIQKVGIDLGGMMTGSSLIIPSVVRTRVSGPAYYLGFLPGLAAVILGAGLSGLGIYRRQTASLFREMEA